MEIQIRNHIRLTLVKLREYNTIGEAYEAALRKILVSSESVDIIVSKIIGLEIKNDYQYLIIMTFVSELITSTRELQRSNAGRTSHLAQRPPTENRIGPDEVSRPSNGPRDRQQVSAVLPLPQEDGDPSTVAEQLPTLHVRGPIIAL
jgi:hypothetical protein